MQLRRYVLIGRKFYCLVRSYVRTCAQRYDTKKLEVLGFKYAKRYIHSTQFNLGDTGYRSDPTYVCWSRQTTPLNGGGELLQTAHELKTALFYVLCRAGGNREPLPPKLPKIENTAIWVESLFTLCPPCPPNFWAFWRLCYVVIGSHYHRVVSSFGTSAT